jgi:hypothetical protein
MIIGELAAGVRILLEKGPSRHHILKYPVIHMISEDESSRKEEAK